MLHCDYDYDRQTFAVGIVRYCGGIGGTHATQLTRSQLTRFTLANQFRIVAMPSSRDVLIPLAYFHSFAHTADYFYYYIMIVRKIAQIKSTQMRLFRAAVFSLFVLCV